MQPINYGVEIQDPTQSFLSAFQTGTAIQDTRLKQQQQQQQMTNQKVILDGLAKIRQPGATVEDVSNLAMILPKDQSETVLKAFALKTDAQKQNALNQAGRVVSALFAGENDIAQNYLTEQANAMRNSGNEEGAKFLETWRGVTEVNPTASQNFFTAELLRLPGGDKIVENIVKLQEDRRAETLTPAKLRQELAAADKAETEAMVKMQTAPDDIARARAARELEQAKAKKEQIQADTELETRLSALNFQKAQINKFKVETRNLDTQGKMLSLDFQAAAQGLPLPSKKTEGGAGAATEDERKAAGWLAQATNAYNNMLGAMYSKDGKRTGAEIPGKLEAGLGTIPLIGEGSAALARSTDRQKFTQAASSLSEALLRAATGAGVNKDEAKQKLEELTPLFTDDADTRKQKLEAIPMYLESLKSRAGRAAPGGYQVPQPPTNSLSITLPNGDVFTAPNQQALEAFKRRAGI